MITWNFKKICGICNSLCENNDDDLVVCQNCITIFHVKCLSKEVFVNSNICCTVCNTIDKETMLKESEQIANIKRNISKYYKSNLKLELFYQVWFPYFD